MKKQTSEKQIDSNNTEYPNEAQSRGGEGYPIHCDKCGTLTDNILLRGDKLVCVDCVCRSGKLKPKDTSNG